MEFQPLLGNQQLHSRLQAALRQERLPHCFLLAGPEGSGKKPLAQLLCAAFLCTDSQHRPCLHCAQCRKVYAGTHPDVIVVDEPVKRTVPVELVRQARADAYIRPNEGVRKVYLFPRAHDLNASGQNALLKILEEPPAYGVFLLLTTNPDRILPTVRSRCAVLSLSPLEPQLLMESLHRRFPQASLAQCQQAAAQSGGFLGPAIAAMQPEQAVSPQVQSFADAFSRHDRLAMLQLTTKLERTDREHLMTLLQQWLELLSGALRSRAGASAPQLCQAVARGRTEQEIFNAIETLRRALEYCNFNVGAGHILGMLAARL